MRRLEVLQEEVEATTSRIVAERPDWPCRRGCDHCCRSLANPMRLSRPEWERLAAYVTKLDVETRSTFASRIDEQRVCALLDRATGACSVYPVRPIACRSYGFYLARDGGRWCSAVEQTEGLTDAVVLGNHDALDRELSALGETRTLAEWWRELDA